MDLRKEQLASGLVSNMLETVKKALNDCDVDFDKMPQARAEKIIDQLETMAVDLVTEGLDVIAEAGATSLAITVHKIGINKETLEAKISVNRDADNAEAFLHLAHSPCTLT